jgi:hypothetical protein
MPNITPTTRQQITSAQQQLSLIRNELDQLVMRGKISRELYSFLDKLLSASSLLSIGNLNLLTDLDRP